LIVLFGRGFSLPDHSASGQFDNNRKSDGFAVNGKACIALYRQTQEIGENSRSGDMNTWNVMDAVKGGLILAGILLITSTVMADETDVIADRLDNRGDRVDRRLDKKGDRIDRRLDRKGERGAQRHDNRGQRGQRGQRKNRRGSQ
jgi:hypothetical protein